MPRLLQNERERAVGMLQAGMTQTEIANHFNCSRMTIYRLLVRVRATGTTSDVDVVVDHEKRRYVKIDTSH